MNVFRGPGGVLFVGETLLFGGFFIAEMCSENYSSVEIFAVVCKVSFIRFSRVRYEIEILIEKFALVFSEGFRR